MCLHEATLDDIHNGCLVCLDCGLVLEQLMYYGGLGYGQTSYDRGGNVINWDKGSLEDSLRDILAVMFIENENLVADTAASVKCLAKDSRVKGSNIDHLVAFCLYENMCSAEIARSPLEVAHACNVSEASILRLERALGRSPSYCPPYLYVDRICATLSIPPSLTVRVKDRVASLPWTSMSRPETVVASALLREVQDSKLDKSRPDLNVTEVSRKLGISSGSLYSMLKRTGEVSKQVAGSKKVLDELNCCNLMEMQKDVVG